MAAPAGAQAVIGALRRAEDFAELTPAEWARVSRVVGRAYVLALEEQAVAIECLAAELEAPGSTSLVSFLGEREVPATTAAQVSFQLIRDTCVMTTPFMDMPLKERTDGDKATQARADYLATLRVYAAAEHVDHRFLASALADLVGLSGPEAGLGHALLDSAAAISALDKDALRPFGENVIGAHSGRTGRDASQHTLS